MSWPAEFEVGVEAEEKAEAKTEDFREDWN